MPWGSLSSAHQILVTLAMKGGPAYAAQARTAARATGALGTSVLRTSVNMHSASKRTFAYNQMLYTMRRYAFFATIAVTGLAIEVAKLGFSYLNTMQTAKVALLPAFGGNVKELNKEMDALYRLAALSPFLFKDTVTAFRSMYPAFKSAGLSVKFTNETIRASMNALAASGRLTPSALNRVSVQLQHMANIGRPSGQVLLALAKDGLPVYQALKNELHLTGNSLADMAKSGYTAAQVIKALNKYIEDSPIYSRAGMRQANLTLSGAWAQFKDILSQAVGRSEAGMFGGLQKAITSVNYSLAPLLRAGKPITLYNIATAIDKAVSPNTHLVINLFTLLGTAIGTTIKGLGLFVTAIQKVLRPFDYLGSLFGVNKLGAKLLGFALGVLMTLFIAYRVKVMLATLATGAWEFAVLSAEAAAKGYAAAIWLMNTALQFQKGMMGQVILNRWGSLITSTSKATRVGYALRGAWAVLTTGVIRGSAGQFVAMTRLEKMMLKLRTSFLALQTSMEAATAKSAMLRNSLLALKTLGFIAIVVLLSIKLKEVIGSGHGHGWFYNLTHDINPFTGKQGFIGSVLDPGGHINQLLRNPFGIGQHHKSPPHAALGATTTSMGDVMVGERGPEVLRLPRGASVIPLQRSVLKDAGSITIHLISNLNLDGKQIATAMATAVTDKKARL